MRVQDMVLEAARKQFCLDTCLAWEDYRKTPNSRCYIQRTVYQENTDFPIATGARCYVGMDSFFHAIICMGQLFLTVDEQIYDWACEKFRDCKPEWFCEFDNLRMIDEKLREYGRQIKDTHVYFLPAEECPQEDLAGKTSHDNCLSLLWYDQQELLQFKENNRFGSAICFSPTQPDVLAVAALKQSVRETAGKESGRRNINQENLAGMAGASLDGEYLWQIGINVDAEYAGKGLACRLVQNIKEEILKRGKVPFYGTSESHTISQTIAWKTGFAPAWTEVSAEQKRR